MPRREPRTLRRKTPGAWERPEDGPGGETPGETQGGALMPWPVRSEVPGGCAIRLSVRGSQCCRAQQPWNRVPDERGEEREEG